MSITWAVTQCEPGELVFDKERRRVHVRVYMCARLRFLSVIT